MKQAALFLLLAISLTFQAAGQKMDRRVRPVPAFPVIFRPGWVNITDVTAGFGLGATADASNPCDKSYYGLTTVFGYQITQRFIAGAGTGAMSNEDRFFVPLFLRGRYVIPVVNDRIAPYLNADGGLLLNFKDFDKETRTFINPGIGVRFLMSPYIAGTAETGILVHHGPGTSRNSFINFKLGFLLLIKQE